MKVNRYYFLALIISGSICKNALAIDHLETENHLAQIAQFAGYGGTGALAGLAFGQAEAEIESWLNQFGSTKISLGLGSHFRGGNDELDMLFPIFRSSDNLIFTQYGVRRQDSRTTGNIGFGQRHFFREWMLGYNTFYDYDITGRNRRWGIGTELWRNYFRLSANGYFPISDWKESKKLDGYDERPAQGGDIRLDGYLPTLPYIGGKFIYEKYFGEEVALFGLHSRQKDPYAITAGINYTPVPMVTLGMDYRSGKAGNHDTQLLANINYRLGVPLSKQMDSNEVVALRSLSENRLDLVERNNTIVMNYRKQEDVKLQLPPELQGKASTDINFTAIATSRYPIDRIVWNDRTFIAAGGKITKLDNWEHYRLTLPVESGKWIIQGQAFDSHGRASNMVSMRVTSISDIKPVPPQAVISNLHMVREGSNVFGNGFGDLIYGAQIDAGHVGAIVSWSLSFNAYNNSEHTSLPVHLSGTATATASGEVKIRIPMSRLPNDSELNYADSTMNFSLSATPEGGESVTINEGNIILAPVQGTFFNLQLDKTNLSLPALGKEKIIATITRKGGDQEPVKNMMPYISTNCKDCALEYDKTDSNGATVVMLSAGKTPGYYEVMVAAASNNTYNKKTIPLIVQ
jgi:adhesin/invasin